MTIGYRSREYAESWREWGRPLELPRAQGFLLRRAIPGTDRSDACGCYPLFDCQDWQRLAADIDDLSAAGELASVTAVTLPLDPEQVVWLQNAFPDLARPFKTHYMVERPAGAERTANRHHRYYARRAMRSVEVHAVQQPRELMGEWQQLYAQLIERHRLRGMQAFSATAFQYQLAAPGMVAFRATAQCRTVAIQLWYHAGDVAYSHLMASSEEGYALNAAYALYWTGIDYFTDRVAWIDLGGAAGLRDVTEDPDTGDNSNRGQLEPVRSDLAAGPSGLAFFKRGWSNATRSTFLCGRVLNRAIYSQLFAARPAPGSDYFPAYRHGEFGG
jgi:hypothetical protein